MPKNNLGQMVTFSIENDQDQRYRNFIWVPTRVGDTVRKIVARRGHPEDARRVAKMNGVRSTTTVLRHRPKWKRDKKRIRVPGELRAGDVFHVLMGDAPRITGGYAKFETIDRPQVEGLNIFQGYDPIEMTFSIRFENMLGRQGAAIEDDIRLLERMAGRGNFPGAADGPPPVIRLSTTNNSGGVVPLIPRQYQWSSPGARTPVWRIVDLEELDSDDGLIRNDAGTRIRSEWRVVVRRHTRFHVVERSAAQRSKKKKKK